MKFYISSLTIWDDTATGNHAHFKNEAGQKTDDTITPQLAKRLLESGKYRESEYPEYEQQVKEVVWVLKEDVEPDYFLLKSILLSHVGSKNFGLFEEPYFQNHITVELYDLGVELSKSEHFSFATQAKSFSTYETTENYES